jgi:hypothetical protein
VQMGLWTQKRVRRDTLQEKTQRWRSMAAWSSSWWAVAVTAVSCDILAQGQRDSSFWARLILGCRSDSLD